MIGRLSAVLLSVSRQSLLHRTTEIKYPAAAAEAAVNHCGALSELLDTAFNDEVCSSFHLELKSQLITQSALNLDFGLPTVS
jgi:hypothetical protein